jgi:radical SAM protein with 4Fe4S-binding SPASM domain
VTRPLSARVLKAIGGVLFHKVRIECDRIPYYFENVPLKKILNWILAESSLLVRPDKPWGWPTHLQLEPTNTCNLNCALCPVSGEMKRPQGHMDFNLFKKLLDEIGDYLFLMLLWDWGEPFLNPRIYEMIAYAKQKGIKIVSSTNGHLFADVREADKVIRSGLDTLIFAMDGISQETYQTYRQGGDLDAVLRGIRTVVARKRALNLKTPFVNLRFIVMKHNEHEVPQLKTLAESLGVDVLTLKTLNPCADDTYGQKEGGRGKEESAFLPDNIRYRRFHYEKDGKTPIRFVQNPCRNLWNAPTIHWDGAVCPCTYDFDERFVLGDLKKGSFREIWNSENYSRMRRRLRENDKTNYFCHECSYAYEGGNCIDEIITDAVFFDQNKI